ncbi:MAG TPA: biotin/lipoyl-containing protein [Paracoccaceae bacterium]
MDLDRLKQIIDWMATQPLHELELAEGEWSVHLVKSGGVTTSAASQRVPAASFVPPATAKAAETRHILTAPFFGVVHLAPVPGGPAFVTPGQAVKAGQTLCVVEAMKVFNTVEADHDATVAEILVASGAEVMAGQPLMRLNPLQE